ncbi:fibroblast growth factor-binding protein 1 [Dunckerocampus dactyliophorus]|uniref:fibroblast growth factor-binding protein 1 n=1 Tax=Dunckerocampus dactyliophorus TaxID=161453 RepID=UPI0024058170|nr:fibroblast growth factor-binding protein 1 [Dunckerocampus dactyliophorus]
MALVTNMVLVLLLACLCQQLALVSCHMNHKSAKTADKRRGQDADNKGTKASLRPFKVRLVGKDKRGCSWAAAGEDQVTLMVTCTQRGVTFSCQYAATPSSCSQYVSNVKLYWKQIGRRLKRHRSLCREGGAPLRARVCKGAPQDADFRLREVQKTTTEAPPTTSSVKSCIPENRKLAQEYCTESWSSFCTFLFTMVQGDACRK